MTTIYTRAHAVIIAVADTYIGQAINAPTRDDARHYARLAHIAATTARDGAHSRSERGAAASIITTALDILATERV